MNQVEFDNQPEYRIFGPVTINGRLTCCGQYKCGICHNWSNVVDFFIVFNQPEDKTVYKCPVCKSESTYFHTPVVVDDSKRLSFNMRQYHCQTQEFAKYWEKIYLLTVTLNQTWRRGL